MKQSISNVWLIGIVFSLILIFSGYLALTISYSRVFKLKNEMLTIIEKHRGMTDNVNGEDFPSIVNKGSKVKGGFGGTQTIAYYLLGSAYHEKGECPAKDGWSGVKELDFKKKLAQVIDTNPKGKEYYYCIKKERMDSTRVSASFYRIRLFYHINLPVLGDLITFSIDGTTSEIGKPLDGF